MQGMGAPAPAWHAKPASGCANNTQGKLASLPRVRCKQSTPRCRTWRHSESFCVRRLSTVGTATAGFWRSSATTCTGANAGEA